MKTESLAAENIPVATRIRPLHIIFSFPVVLASLLALLAVLTVRSRFDDPDMWWHLKLGEVVWTTHHIPATDTFSFTTNHHAYIAHEWLSQLVIYGTYRLGGYSGLMVWLCTFTAALIIAGYSLCSLYSGNAKVAFVGALTIWLFGTVGFAVRPQMIGYFLLIIELALLHLGRTRTPRWLFALPLLFAIWIICHGSFFLGIAVAAIFLVSSFFDFQHGSLVAIRWAPAARRTLVIALALSCAALFLNPGGAKVVFYPLSVIAAPSLVVSWTTEWMPLPLGSARGLALIGVVACVLIVVMVRRSELFLHELLTMAFAVWLAASHRRMLFPFGILIAPILSRVLADSWSQYRPERDRVIPNAVCISLSVMIVFLVFPSPQNLAQQVQYHSPVRAVAFIKAHNLNGPMINDWEDGGYLMWAAPEHPVFIDGRADIFEWAGVLEPYGKWATVQSNPNDLLDQYKINFCLLTRNSPIAYAMASLPQWKAVYTDELSVVFVRNPLP